MHPDESGNGLDDAELARLLTHVDHAAPPITADDVVARARRAPASRFAWAAGVVLVLAAAGVTYALPGSPLRALFPEREASGAAHQAAASPAASGGLLLDASTPALIIFPAPVSGSHLRVVFTEASHIAVRFAPDAAAVDARPDRLLITALAPDTFDLDVPRSARRVEVRVDGQTVFLKAGADVAAGVLPDSAGRYLVPLKGPPS
jgi:hypothetical protein